MDTRTGRLLDGAEGARLFGISEPSFWRLVNAGMIPKVDLSGTGKAGRGRKLWRFREGDLLAYIEANTRRGGPAKPEAPAPPPVTGREALIAAGWDGDPHTPRRPGQGRGGRR